MAGILTDKGVEIVLERSFNDAGASVNHEMILYSNTYTPIKGTLIGDLTEVVAAGYARKTLTDGSWAVASAGGSTTCGYAEQTFSLTASSVIGGWAVVDDADVVIMGGANDTATPGITTTGDVKVTPVATLT
jgi:hypothetical protein